MRLFPSRTMRVRELMHGPAVTCRMGDTMSTAAGLMWEQDCGAIPVTDDAGRVAGMITDRDVCMAAYTKGRLLSDMRVSEGMASEVFRCHVDDAIADVEQTMSSRQIRRVPVVDDDDHPVGIISVNDMARYTASHRGARGMQRHLLRTLASISKPRARA